MPNWKYRLNVADLWTQYKAGELSPHLLGTEVAVRLEKLQLPEQFEDEKQEMVNDFQYVTDIDGFDSVLNRLYDMADTGDMREKLLWVATF